MQQMSVGDSLDVSRRGGRKRKHTYEIGEVIYWSPGPDVAIYYKQNGEKLPNPGTIVIGKIDSGVETLNVPGPLKVKVELIE